MAAGSEVVSTDDPVVSVEWLHSNLGNPHIKILDGSWYMPHEQRKPFQEYQIAHIPGAIFFDLDGIVDVNSDLPHMLPSEEAFAAGVSALGICNEDTIIVYDGKGMFSAPRIWWMFRVFGHDKVWLLDGGFPRWRALGFDIECQTTEEALFKTKAANEATKDVYLGKLVASVNFQTKFRSGMIWSLEQVQKNMEDREYQHVDARSKGRFDGVDPEPRKGIKSGHIPGSICISFPQMYDKYQMLLSARELAKKFEAAGISLDQPVVVSCGSGVTACTVVMGLYRLGKHDVPLYDASWTEWALRFGLTEDN